jgi:uncharacterized membrane protein YfcA
MTWAALLGALAIGLTLGLLGSGGSILTVPVLVYLVGQPERVAIAGSLAIVGSISAVAACIYLARKQISWRHVTLFGVPSMAGSYAGAWLSNFVASTLQLILFAVVMLLAAGFMLRPPRIGTRTRTPRAGGRIALDGALVGLLTGLIGVGGGFLIIPTLVLLGGLSMQTAVGTSLAIITLNAATGFIKYLDILRQHGLVLDWQIIFAFVGIGTIGSIIGSVTSNLIHGALLRQVFGGALFLLGAYILWNNLGHVPR